jgi:iron(III) transport system permease protein
MVLLLAGLVLLPMFWLTVTSLRDDKTKGFTLSHYLHFVNDPSFVKPLITTLWTSAAVGILCVAFAAPMAWLVARTDLPFKRLMRVLVLASFVTPPFLGAFAWVLLGGPNAGLINQWYYGLFGLKPFEATPLINIFSAWGMVFVMALYTFPYVFTFVANSLDLIPSELEEASAILGASHLKTATHITLPLVVPALLAGFLVAFLQSMTLFGAPAILALPAGIDTMTTKIWSLFQFPPQLGLAAAASLPLLIVTVVLLRVQATLMGRRGYSVIGGKSTGQRLIKLRAWKVPALGLFAFVLGCSIVLPYGVLLRTAFVKNWSGPIAGNFSIEHWRFVFLEFSQTKLALINTFILGTTAATVGTILATDDRLPRRSASSSGGTATSPSSRPRPWRFPASCCASGSSFRTRRRRWCSTARSRSSSSRTSPRSFRWATSRSRRRSSRCTRSSRTRGRIFGATRLRTLADITAPLIRNGVIATWLFIFIGSIRELSATILLFTAKTKTVSVTMFDLRESNDWGRSRCFRSPCWSSRS